MVEALLPPNASRLEVDLEHSMAHYEDGRDVPIDRLWRPETCPAVVLPFLAWALGVRRWDPDWPEAVRRQVVADAIRYHRQRGTVAAVRQALQDIGAVFNLIERPGGTAHTISVEVLNSNDLLGTTDTATIRQYIEDAKRFSTHFSLAVSSSLGETDIFIGVAATGMQIADIALTIDEDAA